MGLRMLIPLPGPFYFEPGRGGRCATRTTRPWVARGDGRMLAFLLVVVAALFGPVLLIGAWGLLTWPVWIWLAAKYRRRGRHE